MKQLFKFSKGVRIISPPERRTFTVPAIPDSENPNLFSHNQKLIRETLKNAKKNKSKIAKIFFFAIRKNLAPIYWEHVSKRKPEDKMYDKFNFFSFRNTMTDESGKEKSRILGYPKENLVLGVTKEEYELIKVDSDNKFKKVDSFSNGEIQILIPFANIIRISF